MNQARALARLDRDAASHAVQRAANGHDVGGLRRLVGEMRADDTLTAQDAAYWTQVWNRFAPGRLPPRPRLAVPDRILVVGLWKIRHGCL
ncbi:MAG: hypothetical protein ACI9U2_001122 [Bradymonadia bacterium]|jgi:hypothetical protein